MSCTSLTGSYISQTKALKTGKRFSFFLRRTQTCSNSLLPSKSLITCVFWSSCFCLTANKRPSDKKKNQSLQTNQKPSKFPFSTSYVGHTCECTCGASNLCLFSSLRSGFSPFIFQYISCPCFTRNTCWIETLSRAERMGASE